MALEEPDVHTVIALLRNSLNADQTLGGQAVIPLSDYESEPGFFSRLMDIITVEGPPSDDDVRLLASNYFEEAIMRCWGKRHDAIFIKSDNEKTNLRNKLLSHLPKENDQKIAKKLVKIISKIARFDYPYKWPELLSVLALKLEKGDRLTSHRILEVLSQIIPRLSKEDLRPEISSRLYDCCWELWKEYETIVHYNFLSRNSIGENSSLGQQQDLTIERWSLCTSVIQMLIIYGFGGDGNCVKVPLINKLCHTLIRSVEALVPIYYIFPPHPKLTSVQGICAKFMKDLFKIQKWQWTIFSDETLRDRMVVFCLDTIMNTRHEKNPLLELLLIECMVMFHSVLCYMYDRPFSSHKRVIAENFEKRTENPDVVESLLPCVPIERVKDLCKILITRYFLLTENDLMEWSRDPERFYYETTIYHESECAKLRLHAENLFTAVCLRYGQLLGPVVISVLKEATNDLPTKETDSDKKMLLRVAAYTAVGHAGPVHCDKLDFMKLFEGVLCPELHDDHPDMRIIHWKIACIFQTWTFQVEHDMIKPIFRALLMLLEYDELVARLAACLPLRRLFELVDFEEEGSMDLLRSYYGWCFKLLKDVRDFRSKSMVLECILVGIINFGATFQKLSGITVIRQTIIPFAHQLAYEIEKAWEAPTCDGDLRMSILRALRCLGELEILTPVCYKILRPLLEMFVVLNDPFELCLLEKGMLLWESRISNAPSMNFQLLALFPYLQEVMKNTLDYYPRVFHHIMHHSQVAIRIIDGYINLGGSEFLIEHASVIHKLLVGIYANLDFELKYVRGGGMMAKKLFHFGDNIADIVKAMKGDTKSSVKEDAKNIGAPTEIKEKHGCSSSSEYSTMRVARRILFEDWKKLEEISIRSAGMTPDWQVVSAGVKELGETLLRVFVAWQITSS